MTSSGLEVNLLHLHSHATLWHKRFGHFHTQVLQRMVNFGAVNSLPNICFSLKKLGVANLANKT